MNTSFTTVEKDTVEFNQDGDVVPRYDIMNFQQHANGTFSYVKIGFWNNHTLDFIGEVKPPNGSEKFSSVCSKPCAAGFYKVHLINTLQKAFHTRIRMQILAIRQKPTRNRSN